MEASTDLEDRVAPRAGTSAALAGRTRVKICGITRPEDGRAAAAAGADAIGLVFYPPSPRLVTRERAAAICRALPPMVARVAVFVDASEDEVAAVLREVPVDFVQFHGEETPERCVRQGVPYFKAVRVRAGTDVEAEARRYPDAAAILLDTHRPGLWGGTGTAFDWSLVPGALAAPVILAGGLTVENVAGAIERVRPFAIDVSGGVEREPGIKDPGRIAAFIREVSGAVAHERRS